MRPPLDRANRRLLIVFVTAAITSAAIQFGAWRYATWHDSWLTPRWTPTMILWWGIHDLFAPLNGLLVFFGVVLLINVPEFRARSIVWFCLAGLILVLAFCHG